MVEINDIQSIEELFEVWKEKHHSEGKNCFIVDGIINEEKWNSVPVKVCFLLKESYISPEEYEEDMLKADKNLKKRHWNAYISKDNGHYVYDMAKHQREHAPWFMWCRVENWVSKIFTTLGIKEDYPIQGIAVLDIKKSEGKSKSDYKDILSYAQNDRDLIRKELELIDPDLIVCGATYDYCVETKIFDDLKEVATLKEFGNRKVARDGKRVIIDCYHPAAPRVSYEKAESFFKATLHCVQMMREEMM